MRLAAAMTLDPDGAMHDWIDGAEVIRIPTQELVHLAGEAAVSDVLVDVCRVERPDALLLHPPYDHLTERAAAAIRASGTRLVAYAFDDDIFAGKMTPEGRAAIRALYDRYATTHDVPWATRPLPALPVATRAHEVALVGRATLSRGLAVSALRGAGIRVVTRGLGWPEGWAPRRELEAIYGSAAIVLTTADWEDEAVPMVKHRLVETAMLGCFQVAQEAPDLRRYFPADEVPAYATPGDLVALVRRVLADEPGRQRAAAQARARALAEHTWTVRLPSLIGPVEPREPGPRSPLLDLTLRALASRAEASDRPAAAHALYAELAARHPDDFLALAGIGRTLRTQGELDAALPWLRRAAACDAHPPSSRAVHFTLPAMNVGVGLGSLGRFPPALEPTALLVATLVELGREDEAADVLRDVTEPILRTALGETLSFGPDASPRLREAIRP
jgi:Glycosyl transferases group 1